MKKNGAQKKKRLLWIVIPVAVFALLLSAALIYLESYYHAADDAIAAFSADRAVKERTIGGDMVFEPGGAAGDQPGELSGYEPPYHDFNGITSKFGAHFILRVDKILMKKRYSDAIINGVKAKDFPPLPVDYGYRDSKNFWFHRKTRMRSELLAIRKQSLESVRYAADRADDKVKFTDDALETILNVPRVFLPLVLRGCVEWAKENNVELITAEHMKIINDKRAKEKSKK